MPTWNYDKYPFKHKATAAWGGRGIKFAANEAFFAILNYEQDVICGHCDGNIPKTPPTMRDGSMSVALKHRVWVSALHTVCHACAIEISRLGEIKMTGMVCGKVQEVIAASGPGQERCSQCTLMRNAEAGRWCDECIKYATNNFHAL